MPHAVPCLFCPSGIAPGSWSGVSGGSASSRYRLARSFSPAPVSVITLARFSTDSWTNGKVFF